MLGRLLVIADKYAFGMFVYGLLICLSMTLGWAVSDGWWWTLVIGSGIVAGLGAAGFAYSFTPQAQFAKQAALAAEQAAEFQQMAQMAIPDNYNMMGNQQQ